MAAQPDIARLAHPASLSPRLGLLFKCATYLSAPRALKVICGVGDFGGCGAVQEMKVWPFGVAVGDDVKLPGQHATPHTPENYATAGGETIARRWIRKGPEPINAAHSGAPGYRVNGNRNLALVGRTAPSHARTLARFGAVLPIRTPRSSTQDHIEPAHKSLCLYRASARGPSELPIKKDSSFGPTTSAL